MEVILSEEGDLGREGRAAFGLGFEGLGFLRGGAVEIGTPGGGGG